MSAVAELEEENSANSANNFTTPTCLKIWYTSMRHDLIKVLKARETSRHKHKICQDQARHF